MIHGFKVSLRFGCGAPALDQKQSKTLPHHRRFICRGIGVRLTRLGKKVDALMRRRWRWHMATNRSRAKRWKFSRALGQDQPPSGYANLCGQRACVGFHAARDRVQEETLRG